MNTIGEKIEIRLIDIWHPYFNERLLDWQLWRDAYEGGRRFIERYLKTFSKREDADEFTIRKSVTYLPAFAKTGIGEIKDCVYSRMPDVIRNGGTKTYKTAVVGGDNGVDLHGSSMNYFIGQYILPELLVMGRVGVFVDMPPTSGYTLQEIYMQNLRPYLYIYRTEEIRNWSYNSQNEFTSVLLEESYVKNNQDYDLPEIVEKRYRHMYLEDGKVHVKFYNTESQAITQEGEPATDSYILDLDRIPFHVYELSDSLMDEVARYQVALLNLASSDVSFLLKSNFPFYTEQQDFRAQSSHLKKDQEGTNEVQVGVASGRAYGKDLDRPGFINPSSEPLKASIEKQGQLKTEIRQLLRLAINNLTAVTVNDENRSLITGLDCIAWELQKGENKIAIYWAGYENSNDVAEIIYPVNYEFKTDEERQKESDHYVKILPLVPSQTYRKEIAKLVAEVELGSKISVATLEKIKKEIDAAQIISVDPTTINQDVLAGYLDKESAALARGYPKEVVDKANQEHAERLATITQSQTSLKAPGSRGVNDLSSDPKIDATKEKLLSKDTTQDPNPSKKVRGKGVL